MTKEEFARHAKEYSDKIEKATGERPIMGQAPDVPDCPSCDCCGKDYEGVFECSRCTSVFYCSKECQKFHWKSGGHKAACETMQQQCEDAAHAFLNTVCNEDGPIEHRFALNLWTGLDGAGAYNIALNVNLNGSLQKLMQDEIENADERFSSGILASFTEMLICTLFRSGRNIPGSVFSNIDAYRVKKYVHSSDDAFEKWFEASLKMISIFVTRALDASRAGNLNYFWSVQKMVRDIAAGWGFVFTSSKASKAIFLGTSKGVDESARARAKWIILQLKRILPLFPFDSPDNSAIEGQVNMFTAMVEIRLKRYGIDVGNFMSLIGLEGRRKQMYEAMALPFAEATMAKGRSLTSAESQQAIVEYKRGKGSRSGSESGSGRNNRGKKKGKKNRK